MVIGPANLVVYYQRAFRTAICLAILLAITCMVLAMGLLHMSDARRIFVPPDLRLGALIDGREVPEPTVYFFAATIFQQLNRWPHDGDADYPKNIQTHNTYITPTFRQQLLDDVARRRDGGKGTINELRQRERSVSLPPDFLYASNLITRDDDGAWIITLDLDVKETYDNVTVKQVHVRYPLRVVRYEVDWERNAWGLALDGFAGDGPVRLSNSQRSVAGQ